MENKQAEQISVFDSSVEKFLSTDFGDNSSIDELELDRFRSKITFSREWKQFKYEPRNLSFFTQSEYIDSNYQFELPQFSSASVPQAEQLSDEAKNQNSDYVLYAGGNVWALDWCPRPENKSDSSITFEYLAVSVHPEGSNYHKMGAPLNGIGAIQIWCINSKKEELQASSIPKNLTKKGRPKKDPIVKDPNYSEKKSNEIEGLTVSKPRGRPKKLINPDEKKLNSPKKKGRPRKRPLDEDLYINTPKKKDKSEKFMPRNVEIPLILDSNETLLSLPPPESEPEKSTKKGTKMQNSLSNEKRPKRQVKSTYLRKDPITSCNVENYENTLPLIIEPLDIASPISSLRTKKPKKEKSRKNQDSSPVSCLTTIGSATETHNSPSVESQINKMTQTFNVDKEAFNVGPGPCEKEAFNGGPGPCEKEEELAMPRLVFCLGHMGKVAWDIKWKPSNQNNITNYNDNIRMGYLAILLGNGVLEVWDVPVPNMVQKLYSCNKNDGLVDPRFIKLKPIFRCSKLKCGERQSIPLTLEWSNSPSNDLILAGCHDGNVALWKFSVEAILLDTKPIRFFTADSVPIRSLSWAPNDNNDVECSNLFLTAGEGIKFWDIRDPYRPLWDMKLPQKSVMCVDWLKDPRCVVMSLDDGTIKFLSIPKAANDSPVTGTLYNGRKYEGLFSYTLSLFNIWSIHVSRITGCVAYSVADGSAVSFQMNERFVEKDPRRNSVPYYLCGSFKEDKKVIKISISDENNSLMKDLPLKPIKGPSRYKCDEKAVVIGEEGNNEGDTKGDEICDAFPSKLVAVHKIRWNMNKGCERWLCYGGAGGIIRVQKIPLPLN